MTDTLPAATGTLRAEPALLPAGAGTRWLERSWALFLKAPLAMVLLFLLYIGIGFAAGMIPVLGDVAMALTWGLWGAGFAFAIHRLHEQGALQVGDLFAGFNRPNAGNLFLLGLVYVGGFALLAIATVVLAVFVFGFVNIADFPDPHGVLDRIVANISTFVLLVAFVLTGLFLLIAYLAYAPVLVALHDVPPLTACGMSLRAILRNWLPMTVWGLWFLGLCIASVVTLFLGLLVLFPLMYIAMYISYRDIFLEDAPPAP